MGLQKHEKRTFFDLCQIMSALIANVEFNCQFIAHYSASSAGRSMVGCALGAFFVR